MGGMATIGALTFKTRGRRTPVGISSRTKVTAFDDFIGTAGAAPAPPEGADIIGDTALAGLFAVNTNLLGTRALNTDMRGRKP